MAKGWTTIAIIEGLKERLESVYEKDSKRPQNQKFGAWLNNHLLEFVDYEQKLEQYGSFLEFVDASENRISIFDHKLGKSIAVFIDGHRRELECEFHKERDCIHIGFCFGIPRVYRVLIDNGFRPPKRSADEKSKRN